MRKVIIATFAVLMVLAPLTSFAASEIWTLIITHPNGSKWVVQVTDAIVVGGIAVDKNGSTGENVIVGGVFNGKHLVFTLYSKATGVWETTYFTISGNNAKWEHSLKAEGVKERNTQCTIVKYKDLDIK